MPKKPRLNKQQFTEILERLADGASLTSICKTSSHLPHHRTVLRFVQDSDAAYDKYKMARALQAEILRDEIVDLVTAPLPSDPKLAMALSMIVLVRLLFVGVVGMFCQYPLQ